MSKALNTILTCFIFILIQYTIAQREGRQRSSPPMPVYQPLPLPAPEQQRYLNPVASTTTPLQMTASGTRPPHQQQQQPKMQSKAGMPSVSPVTAPRLTQQFAPTAAATPDKSPTMDCDNDSGKIFSDTPLAINRGVEISIIDGQGQEV
jgi:hypothetical protein